MDGLILGLFDGIGKLVIWVITLPVRSLHWRIGIWVYRLGQPRYGHKSMTAKGEKVRSKIECRMANWFYANGIDYVYEKPAKVWFFTTVRPDFYLPAFNLYIEYFGLTTQKYKRQKEWKLRRLANRGIVPMQFNTSDYKTIEKKLGS